MKTTRCGASAAIACVACVACLCLANAMNVWAQTPPGDVTGNGYISSRDVWMARDYIAGYAPLEDEEKNRADINTDSVVDVADLLGIVNANEATTPMLFISQPQPGDRWPRATTQGVTWESAGAVAEPLTVTLMSSGTTFLTLSTATSDTGVFLWEIPSDFNAGDAYAIRISSPTPGIVDETSTFSILGDTTIPPPTTKLVDGWVVMPTGTPLEPTSLTLYAAGGGAPIAGDWSFTGLEMWNQGEGQFVFLETNAGAEVMMGYIEPDVVTSGVLALTPGHHAEGAIAFSPVMFSLTDAERREVLDFARAHQDFPTLVVMIIQVLKTDPLSLPDYATNPQIYDLAATIASDAYDAWDALPAPVASGAQAAGEGSQWFPGTEASRTGRFRLWNLTRDLRRILYRGSSVGGVRMENYSRVSYGVSWGKGADQWELVTSNWLANSTEKDVRLPDGDYIFGHNSGKLISDHSRSPLARAAYEANVFTMVGLAYNSLAPSNARLNINDAIEKLMNYEHGEKWFLTPGKNADYRQVPPYKPPNVFTMYCSNLAQKRYDESGVAILVRAGALSDVKGRASHRILSWRHKTIQAADSGSVDAQMKGIYENSADFREFFLDWTKATSEGACRIRVTDGDITTPNCFERDPVAAMTVSNILPKQFDSVTLDASDSNARDQLATEMSYRYRSFVNDTFDSGDQTGMTSWTQTLLAQQYHEAQVTVTGDAGIDMKYVDFWVVPGDTASVTIDVTPDSGVWVLLGPTGFDRLVGIGDRLGATAITNAPVGVYILICVDFLPGYDPPEPQVGVAFAGETLRFNAEWTVEDYGIIDLDLPGGTTMTLRRIPAGSYAMGSPGGERGRDNDENSTHTVTFADDFFMGVTEVTQAQWEAVMLCNPSRDAGRGAEYPVYNVTWEDVASGEVNFLERLNRYLISTGQTIGTVRLPSEAEWEYGCRARTGDWRFYFGDSLGCDDYSSDCATDGLAGNRSDFMWYAFNANDPSRGTKPVGRKLPNIYGLHDMSGNVWEWCQDWYHLNYSGAPVDGSAWEDPISEYRVLRGGAWNDYAENCRSANRLRTHPNSFLSGTGFRVVIDGTAD